MPVRKPTLEEWFTAYQLRKLVRDHVHIPVLLELDVTGIARLYEDRPRGAPWTAVLVKGAALAAVKVPAVNRAYLRTLFGDRIIEFGHVSVNLPVVMVENGKVHVGVVIVKNADRLSVSEISKELGAAKKKTLDDTKLTKLVARGSNNVLMRALLRVIHFIAYNLPSEFEKRGGGLSVSSLRNAREGGPITRVPSYGPTGLTIMLTDVRPWPDGRVVMQIGLGIDHVAVSGYSARAFADALHDIMAPREASELEAFV